MPLIIRQEKIDDIRHIYELTKAAFGRSSEADLIDHLRADDALILSQVALLGNQIVGHAAYSLVRISDVDSVHYQPALGPIAVIPEHQGRGIGSALLRAGMAALTSSGYALLFLVGHVSYYPRFGFQPALPLGFTCDYFQQDDAHEPFMVAVLGSSLPDSIRGHVRFHPAFDDAE